MTSKGRVLVVDDEHSIRRAVGRALTARGYDVRLATDGEQPSAWRRRSSPTSSCST
jgi:DNA-binding response OmpR family regulator